MYNYYIRENFLNDIFGQESQEEYNLNSLERSDDFYLENKQNNLDNGILQIFKLGNNQDNFENNQNSFFYPYQEESPINLNPQLTSKEINMQKTNPSISFKENDSPLLDDKLGLTEEGINISDNSKKTFFTSKNNDSKIPVLVSKAKKPQKRIDYAIKFYKTNFSKFLVNYANNIIKKSHLPKELKKDKLSLPNHKSFTGNSKESDNYMFLSFEVKDIFAYYKNENCQNTRQKKNKDLINCILEYIDSSKNEERYEEVKSFFTMNLENAYKMFYDSKDFEKYAMDPKTIYLDEEFQAEKGFSILKKYGFIKLLTMYDKN